MTDEWSLALNNRRRSRRSSPLEVSRKSLRNSEADGARGFVDNSGPAVWIKRLESRGISLAPIEPGWIHEVDRIIFEELAAGRVVRDSQRKLKTLITELAKQKVQAVVLGCTELVLAVDVRANVIPVYDTTALHARMAVEWMLAEEEEARAAA